MGRRLDLVFVVAFHLVVAAVVVLLGALIGFIVGMFYGIGMWLAEKPMPVPAESVSFGCALVGAIVAGVLFALGFRRRR